MDLDLKEKIKAIYKYCGKNKVRMSKFVGVDQATVYRWIVEGKEALGLSEAVIERAFLSIGGSGKTNKKRNKKRGQFSSK